MIWLLFLLFPFINATSLTFVLSPREKTCFHILSPSINRKVGFYFAVQSGGSFEISYSVTDPDGLDVLSAHKKTNADFAFAAEKQGEYMFCFTNDPSTFAEKWIDADITIEGEHKDKPSIPIKDSNDVSHVNIEESISTLENGAHKIAALMSSYMRSQKYHRTRENRSESTVLTSASRIWYIAVIESVVVIAMSVLQVYAVRTFFKLKRNRSL